MKVNKKIIANAAVGALMIAGAGAALTGKPTAVPLTRVDLNPTPEYVEKFQQLHGTSTTEVQITAQEYTALEQPNAPIPVMQGYVFLGATKGYTYTNGKRSLSSGEYTITPDGKATVYVPGEKEETSIDASLMQGDTLSSEGVTQANQSL